MNIHNKHYDLKLQKKKKLYDFSLIPVIMSGFKAYHRTPDEMDSHNPVTIFKSIYLVIFRNKLYYSCYSSKIEALDWSRKHGELRKQQNN